MEQILKFIEFNQYNLPAIIELTGIYILFIWLAVTAWALKDITTRSSNFLAILSSSLLVLAGNVPGLIIYLLIRPQQTIEDSRNKDLFYSSVIDRNVTICSHCSTLVRQEYKHCPNCSHDLQEKCPECDHLVNPIWNYCVSCNYKLIPEPLLIRYWNYLRNFKRPSISLPKLSKPNVSIPKPQLPKVSIPKAKVNTPNVAIPKIQLPKVELPKAKLPKIKWPKIRLPKPNFKIRFAFPEIPTFDESSTAKTKNTVMAEKKHVHEKSIKVTPTVKSTRQKGRGRPKGTHDEKPRKKRSDAGKVRGKYKTT